MVNTEKRLADSASSLLKMAGGRMNYMKLIKLLYIADRESFREQQVSITKDRYVSMNHGPVLSELYNFIKGRVTGDGTWAAAICTEDFSLRLTSAPAETSLSEMDQSILEKVFSEHQNRDEWQMVDFVHTFPEWKFPDGTSQPIDLRDMLRGCGYEDAVAEKIEAENKALARFESMFC